MRKTSSTLIIIFKSHVSYSSSVNNIIPDQRCKSESKIFGPPKMSKSDSDFGRSSHIFLENFWTGHQPQQISRIFQPHGLIEHNSVNDIALCVSLFTSVTVREHLACREQFINVMSNDKYLVNFWTSKHLDIFWTTFFVSIGLRIGQDLRNVRILHLYSRSISYPE